MTPRVLELPGLWPIRSVISVLLAHQHLESNTSVTEHILSLFKLPNILWILFVPPGGLEGCSDRSLADLTCPDKVIRGWILGLSFWTFNLPPAEAYLSSLWSPAQYRCLFDKLKSEFLSQVSLEDEIGFAHHSKGPENKWWVNYGFYSLSRLS